MLDIGIHSQNWIIVIFFTLVLFIEGGHTYWSRRVSVFFARQGYNEFSRYIIHARKGSGFRERDIDMDSPGLAVIPLEGIQLGLM